LVKFRIYDPWKRAQEIEDGGRVQRRVDEEELVEGISQAADYRTDRERDSIAELLKPLETEGRPNDDSAIGLGWRSPEHYEQRRNKPRSVP
jgi:hypothetical protein